MQSEAIVEAAPGQGALAHPDFPEEQLHLGATVEAIEKWMARPLQQEAGVADFAALMAVEEYRAWRRIELRAALRSPYFARIDFIPSDRRRSETYYVGKTFFEGEGVKITGWQAPVASLFYRSLDQNASYDAPEGRIRGQLQLKRRLVIEFGQLAHIADDLDARPLTDEGRKTKDESGAVGRDSSSVLRLSSSTADLLRSVLSEGASPWLRDIIATIQPDQYALITAPANEVLVVQGVAGSGKTSIALHRLSYMVYPALLVAKTPPRCVVFGPNRLFLKYVSAVLPKLGLQHVTQTTFAEWALERLRLSRTKLVDGTFETLLDTRTAQGDKDAAYRRSRLKTSRRMGTLLERYVEWRRQQVTWPPEAWTVQLSVPRTIGLLKLERQVPVAELRTRHARFADKRLAVHRAMFGESVLTHVYSLFETNARGEEADAEAQLALGKKRLEQAKGLREEAERLRSGRSSVVRPAAAAASASPRFGEAPKFGPARASGSVDPLIPQQVRQIEMAATRREQEGQELIRAAQEALAGILTPAVQEQVRKAARAEVERLVSEAWKPIDAVADYYDLLGDPELLRQLSAELFDDDEVDLLRGSNRPPKNTVDLADLPAMHYLYVISQGGEEVGRTQHDFIVVDEAQDVAELDLLSLRLLERRNRVTLLGDLSQSIYGHRGLTSWEQAEAIFSTAPYEYAECAVSYRTTAEITALANRVLRAMDMVEARAFDRHGPEPTLTSVDDDEDLVRAVVQSVQGALSRRCMSVAVLARTADRAQALSERLAQAGLPDAALIDRPEDVEYRGGVVVLPVHLAKGLEFDAAVVVDVDAQRYAPTPFDARLLYVALTRAMHEVHVLWQGDRSPLLR